MCNTSAQEIRLTLKYSLSTRTSAVRCTFAEGAQVTAANPLKSSLQARAPPSAPLASGAIPSTPANLTQSCRYMLDTHVYQHLSPPLPFGQHSQLMTKLLLRSATSVSMGEGSQNPEKVLAVNSERSGLWFPADG